MRGRGGGRTRRGRGGSSCDRRCGVFASGDFVWEKSTPACVVVRQLWRGNKTCRLRVSRQLRCPKVSKGRAESPLVRPQAHTPCHGGEGRADYGAGVGLAVSWGAHTFLSMAKEKCAKESQRHGDYGKKALIAHFDGGAHNVARNGVGQLSHTGGARSCSPFSAVKMGGPFSLRCLSPLCSPAAGAGHNQSLQGGMLWRSLCFFARPKASGKSNPRRPFPRAMRPVAEWRSESAKRQRAAPDRRAVAPVVPRR